MTRVLVITSCTGKKTITYDQQLTIDDFARGDNHLRQRAKKFPKLMHPAQELYTSLQYMRLIRGVQFIREYGNRNGVLLKLGLWVLSAGYGLVPGCRKLAPYECTFQGVKSQELRD